MLTFRIRMIQRFCLAAVLLFLAGARPAFAYMPRVLRIGFVPSENVQEVMRNAEPLVAMLRRELKMDVVPFVATDYTGVIEAMRAKKLDAAFFAPGAYVLAEREAKARVILKVIRKGKGYFYAVIFTRKDSGIKSLQDLKNRTFAFGDPDSLSGSLYPKLMFLKEGINPDTFFKRVYYAGGHDATVLAVFNKEVDAGATFANDRQGNDAAWDLFLKNPEERSQIQALAYSKPLPSDNIAVANGLDASLVNRLRLAFVHLSKTRSGLAQLRRLYGIDGFVPATPAEYAPIREVFERLGFKQR